MLTPVIAAPTLPRQRGPRYDPRATPRPAPPGVPGRGRRVRSAQAAPRPPPPPEGAAPDSPIPGAT